MYSKKIYQSDRILEDPGVFIFTICKVSLKNLFLREELMCTLLRKLNYFMLMNANKMWTKFLVSCFHKVKANQDITILI